MFAVAVSAMAMAFTATAAFVGSSERDRIQNNSKEVDDRTIRTIRDMGANTLALRKQMAPRLENLKRVDEKISLAVERLMELETVRE